MNDQSPHKWRSRLQRWARGQCLTEYWGLLLRNLRQNPEDGYGKPQVLIFGSRLWGKRLITFSILCSKCKRSSLYSYQNNDWHVVASLSVFWQFTPTYKQYNQELPLLLTSSAHIPPAPPWPISCSIIVIVRTQLNVYQDWSDPIISDKTVFYNKKLNYSITSKNTPRSVSGIFRASFGEASTLRVTIWVELLNPDAAARHLLAMQKIRSKKWRTVRGSPSLEPMVLGLARSSLVLSVRLLNKYGKNWSC